MYIANTARMEKEFNALTLVNQINSILNEHIVLRVSQSEIAFKEHIREVAAELRNLSKETHDFLSDDNALILAMVLSVLDDEQISDFFPDDILSAIAKQGVVFHKGEIEENPYFKNISFNNEVSGNFTLSHCAYKKYELFMYDTTYIYNRGVFVPRLAVFDHDFSFPAIFEGDTPWMTITPNEIYTMARLIENAFGNVLMLGCGLGYFAYMASLKSEVTSVTIIEKSQDVISLFSKYILPQFPHKENIKIIHADAFSYLDDLEDGQFDYCFADIWTGYGDTDVYLNIKDACRKFNEMKIDYWIEDAMLSYISGIVFLLLFDEFIKNRKHKKIDFSFLDLKQKHLHEYVAEKLKNVRISEPEQLQELLSIDELAKIF